MADRDNDRFVIKAFGVEIQGPSKRTAEFITVLSLALLLLLGGGAWLHRVEANDNAQDIKGAIDQAKREQISAIRESTERNEKWLKALLKYQVQQACLTEFRIEERPAKAAYCKELAIQTINAQ